MTMQKYIQSNKNSNKKIKKTLFVVHPPLTIMHGNSRLPPSHRKPRGHENEMERENEHDKGKVEKRKK